MRGRLRRGVADVQQHMVMRQCRLANLVVVNVLCWKLIFPAAAQRGSQTYGCGGLSFDPSSVEAHMQQDVCAPPAASGLATEVKAAQAALLLQAMCKAFTESVS
jgi:hypothetical protein